MEKNLGLFDCLDRPFSFFGRPLADILVLAVPFLIATLSKKLSIWLVLAIILAYIAKRSLRRIIPPHFFAGLFYWSVLPPKMCRLLPSHKRFFLR